MLLTFPTFSSPVPVLVIPVLFCVSSFLYCLNPIFYVIILLLSFFACTVLLGNWGMGKPLIVAPLTSVVGCCR
jgi:hypothetical protein